VDDERFEYMQQANLHGNTGMAAHVSGAVVMADGGATFSLTSSVTSVSFLTPFRSGSNIGGAAPKGEPPKRFGMSVSTVGYTRRYAWDSAGMHRMENTSHTGGCSAKVAFHIPFGGIGLCRHEEAGLLPGRPLKNIHSVVRLLTSSSCL
jgi:hypothetical protein